MPPPPASKMSVGAHFHSLLRKKRSEIKALSESLPRMKATLKGFDFSSTDAQEIVQSRLRQGIYKKNSHGTALTIRQARKKGLSQQEIKGLLLSNKGLRKGIKKIPPGNQLQRNTRPQSSGKGNTMQKQGDSLHGNRGNPQRGPSSHSPRQ